MSREETQTEPQGTPSTPSGALVAPDSLAAIHNAVRLWAEHNTRSETLARAEKVKDRVSAVASFFDFASKYPEEATPEDVSRWCKAMEARGLRPTTVYARVSLPSAFYR